MKKLLLSFFMCMLAIIGMQAEEVTFDFTNPESLTPSIDIPVAGSGTNIGTEPFVSGVVSISATDGGTASRIWNSNGSYDFRVYKGATLTFTVQDGYVITSIATPGASLNVSPNGTQSSITVNITANLKFKTITVGYEAVGEGGGEEPETPVEPTPEPVVPELGGKYTIVFNNTEGDDHNVAATSATFVDTYILSSDIVALSCTETNNCYKGKANYGLKMSTGSVNGSFTLAFEKEYYVKSVVINAVKFKSSEAAKLSVNNSQAKSLSDSFTDYMFDVNSLTQTIKVDMTKRGYIKSMVIDIVCPENITSNKCYAVAVGNVWDEPEGCWYAAKFINKNTGKFTWSAVPTHDEEHNGYVFYLAPGNTPLGHEPQLDPDYKYTHVEFVQIPGTVEEPADIRYLDLADVEGCKTTGEIYYDGEMSTTYDLANKTWKDEATALDRVEMAGGIGYAYGVVSAEGAIEVYNVNGAVVARGNDNVDLRGLGRGVYIIRNGNQVRKVVR